MPSKGVVGTVREIDFQKLGQEADLQGDYVMQQIMLPKGQVPHVTNFSRAVLKPKQVGSHHLTR